MNWIHKLSELIEPSNAPEKNLEKKPGKKPSLLSRALTYGSLASAPLIIGSDFPRLLQDKGLLDFDPVHTDMSGKPVDADRFAKLLAAEKMTQDWMAREQIQSDIYNPVSINKANPFFKNIAQSGSNWTMPSAVKKLLLEGLLRKPGVSSILRNQFKDVLQPDRGTIYVNSSRPAVGLHEGGHLVNSRLYEKLLGERWAGAMPTVGHLGRTLGSPAAILAALAAPSDSFIGRNAWAGALLSAAPTLVDEGMASVRALNEYNKVHGMRETLRTAPDLALAFSTYAALPALSSAAAYLINRYKQRNKDREE